MHEYFGMSGTQLKWFESYLSNREQQCMVNGMGGRYHQKYNMCGMN